VARGLDNGNNGIKIHYFIYHETLVPNCGGASAALFLNDEESERAYNVPPRGNVSSISSSKSLTFMEIESM